MRAIDIFVDYFDGNQTKAAAALGKKQGHVWYWLKKGNDLPLEFVPKAARLINKKPSDLRPDIFGDPDPSEHAQETETPT